MQIQKGLDPLHFLLLKVIVHSIYSQSLVCEDEEDEEDHESYDPTLADSNDNYVPFSPVSQCGLLELSFMR